MKQKPEPETALEKSMNLLMLHALRGLKQKEQIDMLDRAGFGQSEIANLLQTTTGNVSVRLAEIRRARKKPLKEEADAENGT